MQQEEALQAVLEALVAQVKAKAFSLGLGALKSIAGGHWHKSLKLITKAGRDIHVGGMALGWRALGVPREANGRPFGSFWPDMWCHAAGRWNCELSKKLPLPEGTSLRAAAINEALKCS